MGSLRCSGRKESRTFLFLGVGSVSGASSSPRGCRPDVKQQGALDVGFLKNQADSRVGRCGGGR